MVKRKSDAKSNYLTGLNRASESDWPVDANSISDAAEALESAYGTGDADFNRWASNWADKY